MSSKASPADSLSLIVDVAFRVATMHRARVSLSELEQLLPSGSTYDDLVSALRSNPRLSSKYVLKDGYVVSREEPALTSYPDQALQQRSKANIAVARWLARAVGARYDTLIAVSGSTSYRAPAKMDDVDLFCVTPRDSMWVFLAKSLVFTRLSRLTSRSRTPVCLSCVMDSAYAEGMFSEDRGALFARDALVAHVISGEEVYARLLGQGPWMSKYFPKMYSLREGKTKVAKGSNRSSNWGTRVANRVLYATLGRYILAKTHSHNKALLEKQNFHASFKARIGPDHLIYESSKYIELQKIYRDLKPGSGTAPEPEAGMELIERGPKPGSR